MTFEEKLRMHAYVLVRVGVNLQSGQVLRVSADAAVADFATLVVEEAYRAGARYVALELKDERAVAARIAHSANEEDFDFVPPWVPYQGQAIVDGNMATMRIDGALDTGLFSGLDPRKLDRIHRAYVRSLEYYYEQGIMPQRIQWCVAAAATPWWAAVVFPKDHPDRALRKLWDAIFSATRSDRPDAIEAWAEHDALLHARRDYVNELGIRELRFTGPGTDLRVGLSPQARFLGGSKTTPLGVAFNANLPTEEIFTAPNASLVDGAVRVTRPVVFNGVVVSGLKVEFRNGEVVAFTADAGEEAFAAFLESDPGARRLGEVALVGIDSPIFQSGLVFEEILFDENAACHIAFGKAYHPTVAINHADPAEREAHGFNSADVHHDVMISDEHTKVSARLRSGKTVALIRKGAWVI